MILKSVVGGPFGPTEYPDGLVWMLLVRTDKGDKEVFLKDLADCLDMIGQLMEGPVEIPEPGKLQ